MNQNWHEFTKDLLHSSQHVYHKFSKFRISVYSITKENEECHILWLAVECTHWEDNCHNNCQHCAVLNKLETVQDIVQMSVCTVSHQIQRGVGTMSWEFLSLFKTVQRYSLFQEKMDTVSRRNNLFLRVE